MGMLRVEVSVEFRGDPVIGWGYHVFKLHCGRIEVDSAEWVDVCHDSNQ